MEKNQFELLMLAINGLRTEMNARFDAVDKRFDAVEKDVKEIKTELRTVREQTADTVVRVVRLEGLVEGPRA